MYEYYVDVILGVILNTECVLSTGPTPLLAWLGDEGVLGSRFQDLVEIKVGGAGNDMTRRDLH